MSDFFALLCVVLLFSSPLIMLDDLITGLALMVTSFAFGLLSVVFDD